MVRRRHRKTKHELLAVLEHLYPSAGGRTPPQERRPGLVVTARTIAEVLAGWVGVPAEALLETESTGGD
jgi:hypothetical protein